MLKTLVFMFLMLLIVTCYCTSDPNCDCEGNEVKRSNFPREFKFGAASAAFQYEGAYKDDGKGLSNWDYYMHKYPERIKDKGATGNVADDFYHRYKEDIALMKNMGLDTFRFSISWSRILPYGSLNGSKVNQKGIDFYNSLINELLDNGIEPFATVFHWDVPLALEKSFGGFLNYRIVKEFHDYAEICYREFGDRVKHWVTFNEPHAISNMGYTTGYYAPGRCSSWQNTGCTGGDSGIEPYIVTHNQLLAHAAAVKTYREKYQNSQKGKIGITLDSYWMLPYSASRDDFNAQQRALDFILGWYLHPLTYGEYPASMRELVGSRLPKFTKEESERVKGSFDFLGLNYFSRQYAKSIPTSERPCYTTDSNVVMTGIRDDIPYSNPTGSDWIFIYPKGLQELLRYVKRNYNNPLIWITENGVSQKKDETLSVADACNDVLRQKYHHDHLCCLKKAISDDDVNVVGYIVWSFLDNLEWTNGYSERFGLYYVDFKNNLTRHEKYSAKWLKSILANDEQESLAKTADH